MKLMTISEVTKIFNVTPRMLRYYDEIGLLPSCRKENYAYRVYDEFAIKRLQQILTLRKLRIPLKKITLILNDPKQIKIIDIFQESISEVDEEISALQIIKDIMQSFVERISYTTNMNIKLNWFDNTEIIDFVQTLSLSKINFKENISMDDLNKANENLNKLTDKNVRIIYLPPATVASSHSKGYEPERDTARIINKFVLENNLSTIKPDFRSFGFNHPNPIDETNYHGYELWVTIPDDMKVPAPLVKKHFSGGLYAAHMIVFGDFQEWELLCNWAENSYIYAPNYNEKGEEVMGGCLEEHLNYKNNVLKSIDGKCNNFQLDLLLPIKEK